MRLFDIASACLSSYITVFGLINKSEKSRLSRSPRHFLPSTIVAATTILRWIFYWSLIYYLMLESSIKFFLNNILIIYIWNLIYSGFICMYTIYIFYVWQNILQNHEKKIFKQNFELVLQLMHIDIIYVYICTSVFDNLFDSFLIRRWCGVLARVFPM